MPAGNVHADFYLPTHAPVVGPRGAARAAEGPAPSHRTPLRSSCGTGRMRGFVIVGDGETGKGLNDHIKEKHLERTRIPGGVQARCAGADKGLRRLCDELGIPKGVHRAGGRDGRLQAGRANRGRGIPEVMVEASPVTWCRPRSSQDGGRARRAPERRRLARPMGAAALSRVKERFTVERMVEATASVYEELLKASLPRPFDLPFDLLPFALCPLPIALWPTNSLHRTLRIP
jgi:hypothetical protein